MPRQFSEADWLKELTRLTKPTAEKSGFLTSAEISKQLKLSTDKVRTMLAQAMDEERLERRYEIRPAICGQMAKPCYRIKAEK